MCIRDSIQPKPAVGAGVFLMWPVFFMILAVTTRVFGADRWLAFYAILFVSAIPIGILIYWYSFEVQRWRDSDYSPYASE